VGKMMNHAAVKIAVSALAIGASQVSCKPAGQAFRPESVSARVPQSGQQAAVFNSKAQIAMQKGALGEALRYAEKAVELSPREAGYRLLLGDLYLKNGRFQSAETSFGDVLALDPGNGRAALSLALAQIALGKTGAAIARLDALATTAAPGDLGLAYALAGHTQRAIEMLEPAARAPEADARVRQNLALAYALAGDWQKARTTAAQDVSPAQLGARMQQWASFVQPSASWDQVAGLLGVTPVEDGGQPVRLALAQPDNNAYAAAPAPAPVPAQAAPVEAAPVQFAAVEAPAPAGPEQGYWEPDPQPRSEPQPEREISRPVYAEAIRSLVDPQPAVMRASMQATQAPIAAFDAPAPRARPRSTGRFVVQLGAFGSASAVERAWAQAYRRYGFGSHTPLSTTIKLGRGTFHRLSVAGFDSHADASRACRSVKAKGGACFVRAVAGDAPVRWASRYANRPA
jgi:Flp pilus assembly protein TadD